MHAPWPAQLTGEPGCWRCLLQVGDFGLARVLDGSETVKTQTYGTVSHMVRWGLVLALAHMRALP